VALSPYEVFISGDGTSWRKAGPVGLTDRFTALAAGPDFILLGAESGRMYRSSDGRRWEVLEPAVDPYARRVAPIRFLALSPRGDEVLASSGQGIVRSTDQGDTWEPVADPFWNVQKARSILCIGYAGSTPVVVTRTGAYRGTGREFVPADKGLPEGVAPVIAAAEDGRLVVALPGAGIYVTGSGKSWNRLPRAPDDPIGFVGFTSTGYLAAGPFSPLHASQRKGREWKRLNGISPAFAPVSSRATETGAMIILRGKGLVWLVDSGLESVELPASLAAINTLLETSKGRLAGTQGGVYFSPSGSSMWEDVTPPSLGGPVNRFLKLTDGRILLASGGFGVFVSDNGGRDWIEWNETLGTANDVRAILEDSGGVLAATENGLMIRGIEAGSTWQPAGRGIGRRIVRDLVVDNGLLFAATETGLFSAPPGGGFHPVEGFSGSVRSMAVQNGAVAAVVDRGILFREASGPVREMPRLPDSSSPVSVALMDGQPVAGSDKGTYRWQGSGWFRLGSSTLPVDRLSLHSGELIVVSRGGGTHVIR
jgi:photosystem II stability/assembly factor-like uncharacterized protein